MPNSVGHCGHLIVGSNVLTPYQTSCKLSELEMVANQTMIVACEDLSDTPPVHPAAVITVRVVGE